MKKGEIMTICGEGFEYCGKTASENPTRRGIYDYADITDAYVRPSETKKCIWESWCMWLDETQKLDTVLGGDIWISSRNAHFFTISGYLLMEDPETGTVDYWEIMITSAHNRIWKCEE